MKENWLLVFAAICLIMHFAGCDQKQVQQDERNDEITALSKSLIYFKDANTHLCFAGMYVGYQAGTLTNVPCTPEVEKVAHLFISGK